MKWLRRNWPVLRVAIGMLLLIHGGWALNDALAHNLARAHAAVYPVGSVILTIIVYAAMTCFLMVLGILFLRPSY